ncbi:hypothetical protein SprV_0200773800 [Sparganum proliferum]
MPTTTIQRVSSLRLRRSAPSASPTKGTGPPLSSDGSIFLSAQSQILKRWAEHFRNVFNCPSTIFDAAIDRFPEVEINVDLDLPPSLPGAIRAVQQLSSGKAPGFNAITTEIDKHSDYRLMGAISGDVALWTIPSGLQGCNHHYKRKRNRIHLVRMGDTGLPKQLFYGDVATGARRTGGPGGHYKDTLRNSLERLNVNPEIWEDLVQDRLAWRREVKSDAAIYEARRIAVTTAKGAAGKSQASLIRDVPTQPHPKCPRCQ